MSKVIQLLTRKGTMPHIIRDKVTKDWAIVLNGVAIAYRATYKEAIQYVTEYIATQKGY
jgi:hypothetical protein